MNTRLQELQELVRDSLYPVDESAVASAIIARVWARRMVPDAPFRGDTIAPQSWFAGLSEDVVS